MEKGVVRSISVTFNLETVKQRFELFYKFWAEINYGVFYFPPVEKTSNCQKKQQLMRLALCSRRKQRVYKFFDCRLGFGCHLKDFVAVQRASRNDWSSVFEFETEVEILRQLRACSLEIPIERST